MKPPERGALLSISASAARTFFPDSIKGLRIRTTGDVVTLKGTESTTGADVVAVEQRGRGGLSAMVGVGGSQSPDFFRLLRRSGFRSSAPFFLLTEEAREWVGLKHWKAASAPLNQPYIRVWMGESPTGRGRKAGRPATEASDDGIDWRRIRRVLSDAKTLLGRRGRVPRDLRMSHDQARRNLEQFERLVTAVLPERGNPDALQARLDRAMELRQAAEEQRDAANEEREAVIEEMTALQRVLDQERRERRTGVKQPSEPPPRQRGGRRRRQFTVQTEPEDHVEPDDRDSERSDINPDDADPSEPAEQGGEMLSGLETELEGEHEEIKEGLPEGSPDPDTTAVDEETEQGDDKPPVRPDTEQPPTDDIQFPVEGEGEDDTHHE